MGMRITLGKGLLVFLSLGLVGSCLKCGHEKQAIQTADKPHTPESSSPPVKLNDAVSEFTYQCRQGRKEECNAIDDNCNGIIDEGCGYRSGAIQITVGWDTGSDIDLYVTDSAGETICFRKGERDSSTGGHMDQDARGDCRESQKINRIENVYWTKSPELRGEFKVELHYFSPCGDNQQTTATVSVAIEGKILGVYQRKLQPEERAMVVSFNLM